jgi:hypothetical protein
MIFCILLIVTLSGLLGLCTLRLEKSLALLKKRTDLFLCVKETKGELKRHLVFMGRTNWALLNTTRAQLIMVLIPGLQGMALNADNVKKTITTLQRAELFFYLTSLGRLKKKGCPLDPRLVLTPFQLAAGDFRRRADKRAILRGQSWKYHFISPPWGIGLHFTNQNLESVQPKVTIQAREIGEKFSFLLPSP